MGSRIPISDIYEFTYIATNTKRIYKQTSGFMIYDTKFRTVENLWSCRMGMTTVWRF